MTDLLGRVAHWGWAGIVVGVLLTAAGVVGAVIHRRSVGADS